MLALIIVVCITAVKTLGTKTRVASGAVHKVTLLGHDGPLRWKRIPGALIVGMPAEKPNEIAYALRIEVDGELE